MALKKRDAGYTLTEAMMTVAIIGVLVGSAAPILKQLVSFWRQTTARYEIERDVRVGLDLINRFLRQAKRRTVVIDQKTGQPPFSRIAFTTITGANIAFWQEANELKMQISSGTITSSTLSSRVGFIAFTYPKTTDPSIISVAVTMQAPTYLGGKKALQLSIQKVRVMN